MENNGSAGDLHCSIRGSGIPLLFVHPPVLPGTVFERQVSELSPFLQTIVPDLRGHGRSAPSPGGGASRNRPMI
ncbi:hypothetical protein MJA45_13010 [Paenibacillus aurantius]|uniref:Alpha/beta hydrolase n=1 Tax=Paenibacillus aurantius TaxID=2918900 RepID=A0AA96LMF8_9BACL|nr:hypothetical protein [Paenibacillus aurantius]WNQ13892.1 hypothetical protein MJA45_13010 [Paenibacillus aurantius]